MSASTKTSRPCSRRSLLLITAVVLSIAAAPATILATAYDTCSCAGGTDWWHNPIPESSTYCGFVTCGLDSQQYECTQFGWQVRGSCGSSSCYCTAGGDEWGEPIPASSTFCGFVTCGADLQEWTCSYSSSWYPSGQCDSCEWCRCYGGYDQYGNPISPASTYCGYITIGSSGERWQCTAGGWDLVNNGSSTNNHKLGLNTAVWLEQASGEITDMDTAVANDLGYYLMMLGVSWHQDWNEIDSRIVPALQNAVSRGLKPIFRLCQGDTCTYTGTTGAMNLVSMLNNQYLADNVTGPWYIVIGPNEAPSERWISSVTQGMSPGCGLIYCDYQVDIFASEIATWVDTVLDNLSWSRLQRNGGDIGIISPVFDCHHPNTPRLISRLQAELVARGRSLRDFDAIGVNAYNLHDLRASSYINDCKQYIENATGYSRWYFDFFVTETGMLERSEDGTREAVALERYREVNKTLRNDSNVDAVLFFNATGRNTDPAFSYNVLNKPCTWKYVLGGHGFD